ncbi:hypothetical protein C725_2848 [Pacificimonas flava]|uniref:Uncharacterized protein n=1 Tax=Pacificimonas flava TaxID=1234595 RepID=M2S8V8_9SPHN|nr:hypothetical protein C725_2848 [Pacificimonas flava]
MATIPNERTRLRFGLWRRLLNFLSSPGPSVSCGEDGCTEEKLCRECAHWHATK